MSWRRFFRRKRNDADLEAEIESYLAEEAAENIARGLPEDEARRQARMNFGSVNATREILWQQNTLTLLDSPLRDLRYALRTLLRTPGFSLIAIGVMALCIGASTSLFTIVRSVLLKPLPFRDPDQLVMVHERYRLNQFPIKYGAVSPGDYFDWREQTHGFVDMAAWVPWAQFNFSGDHAELPEVLHAGAASWNFFPLLGITPALGRNFTQTEDRWNADTVILTWSFFERRFGADPSILGKQIHLDSKPYTVIGVLPRSFNFPDTKVQLWVPYQSITPPRYLHHHAYHQTQVVARLKPGVSLADAIAQISAVQHQLRLDHPDQAVCEAAIARSLNDDLARDVRQPLLLLVSAVTCMLLIGCLNVANLLVARGAARQKEIAIRGALGAQRLTLIRGQLAESLVICFTGGIAGVLLSLAATQWLAHAWKDLPSATSIHVDTTVLAFACGLVFLTALLAGLLPAIDATGRSVLASLQASARSINGGLSRTSLRKGLLAMELAVTVVLLIAAGLLLRNFLALRSTDLRCATNNVLTMVYSLPKQKYDTPDKDIAFHEQLVDRISAMPGILAVGIGETVPGTGEVEDDIFDITEHPPRTGSDERLDALVRRADPGYFNALQIPLLSGRLFTREDTPDRGLKVIINHELARQQFPNENPIGRHLRVHLWNDATFEIIGIVADTIHQPGEPVRPTFYTPELSGSDQDGTLVIRTATDALAQSTPVQKQIAALDPDLPVENILTMEQILGNSVGDLRLMATLVLAFAALSLLLASVGLYGVLSYLMTQRTTELGVRIALGAQRRQVLGLMLLDGLRPVFFGLAFGLMLSFIAVRILRSTLYNVRLLDPAVFALVALTLLAVATLACMVPAWRASRLDPMQALRTE